MIKEWSSTILFDNSIENLKQFLMTSRNREWDKIEEEETNWNDLIFLLFLLAQNPGQTEHPLKETIKKNM